jgi:hypothetical protein
MTAYRQVSEPSFWLRARLVDLRTRLASGLLEPCPHLTNTQQRRVSALWLPDRVSCEPCTGVVFNVSGPSAFTCDRCRQTSRRIFPSRVNAADLTVLFGLCPSCQKLEVTA